MEALKGVESSKDVENQWKVYKNSKRYKSAQDLYNKQWRCRKAVKGVQRK